MAWATKLGLLGVEQNHCRATRRTCLPVLQQLGTHHIKAIQLQIQHVVAQPHQRAGLGGGTCSCALAALAATPGIALAVGKLDVLAKLPGVVCWAAGMAAGVAAGACSLPHSRHSKKATISQAINRKVRV